MSEDYSKRIIVFMDILGFKNLVADEKSKDKLFLIMKYLKWVEDSNYNGVLSMDDLGREITVFSDSIVISYDANIKGALFYILMDIIHIQLDFANQGVYLRGGITVGELYHKHNIVFGPGMVKAYELESIHAKYPRIILEKDLIVFGVENRLEIHSIEEELTYIANLLKEDDDKYFYIDFLNQREELDNPYDINNILNILRENILRHTIDYVNPSIYEKYTWLRKYYNICVDEKFKIKES
ncbi:hypothetical protein [Clostridium perfringens]|uniref:hypothetical protein n=1 Tax=Clostridium perfringens TaxID=1502 RepID=UPI0028CCCF81|nr:hypothetical protein [Clostridium perfringens]MDT7917338.1 hypothetical protein [Clostridium perfringens]MDT7935730.1 hypothetical protein [Clostridium perfringens]MDT7938876.1 hypothetical protein [Clostridium perfringens]MDT7966068.1 hypothetical protein [Clostridium perfringens]MDT7990759.1 hypothetical protein [Clostridium perfringens]